MTLPKYIIKRPVYQYAKSYHYFEIVEGEFAGLQFNFSELEVFGEDENGNTQIKFIYNLLKIPDSIEVEDSRIENLVGQILQHAIEEGTYEFDTK